jgi:thiol:disulfide interchange protein
MRRTQSLAVRSLLLLLAGALLLPLSQAQGQTKKVGVQWSDGTLQQVLDEAAAKDKMVMIDFWAGHCGQCGVMTTELWDTPDGAKLADGLISIQLDTTTPTGKEGMDRYPLTGLPCIIFLRSDGTEVDRVEGYMSKQEFLSKASTIKEGMDPLPGMEALLK